MEFVYDNYVFKTKIEIEPDKINSFTENYIDKILLLNILNKFENKCNSIGFVKKNSIKILKRSVGYHNPITFNNKIYFNVLCSAKICNPIKNNIYLSKITGINKIGIIAKIITDDNISPLSIIISKHNQSINVNKLNIGDNIYIQVLAKKFTLNSEVIKTIANILNNNYITNLKKHYNILKELLDIKIPINFNNKTHNNFINKTYINSLKFIINNNIVNNNILFIYTYLLDINKYELIEKNIKKIKNKYINYLNSIKINNNKLTNNHKLLEYDNNIDIINYVDDFTDEESDNDNFQDGIDYFNLNNDENDGNDENDENDENDDDIDVDDDDDDNDDDDDDNDDNSDVINDMFIKINDNNENNILEISASLGSGSLGSCSLGS
jgi:DNA-directed RNA polymerase subunit E'/Rpb7